MRRVAPFERGVEGGVFGADDDVGVLGVTDFFAEHVAVFAAGGDFVTALPGVPRVLRPFDF